MSNADRIFELLNDTSKQAINQQEANIFLSPCWAESHEWSVLRDISTDIDTGSQGRSDKIR